MDGASSQASGTPGSDEPLTPSDLKDPTLHHSGDPICAAMYTEKMESPPPSANGSGAKCPIRFLDQHSPEEVARYFETHKHEIPRSHEICVKRYQRNENDIRKLDAKYGNLVSMIQGLGQKHQPMLPEKEEEYEDPEEERISNERVENWAHAVSTDGIDHEEAAPEPEIEDDRESRFDRPLKEIRVGESPSRPWGISVPIFDPPEDQRPESPPPAPVSAGYLPKLPGKCPFDHGTKVDVQETLATTPFKPVERSAEKCPFPHSTTKQVQEGNDQHPSRSQPALNQPPPQPTFTQAPQPAVQTQPAFINPPEQRSTGVQLPQMIFTGPVFIGYPMEQAMAFMQQYRNT
jgi:hypothetical protein